MATGVGTVLLPGRAVRRLLAAVCVTGFAACRAPGPRVASAEEAGVVGQNDVINGRDGGGSALAFGRSIWTYGDTTLTTEDEWGRTWHENSVSMTDDLDASDGIGGFTEPLDSAGVPRHLVPPTDAEYEFNEAHWDDGDCVAPCGARWAAWPGTPVWDAARERALVFYGLIYAEPGDFNFEGVGTSIATWDDVDAPATRPILDPDAEHPDLVWAADEPALGVASAIEDDDLYSFACDQSGLARPCKLARAPLDDVTNARTWTWWNGHDWTADAAGAAALFDGAPIMSLSFDTWLDAWLVVYSPPLEGRVHARTAPALTGPWSAATLLYDPPGDDAPYDANHHPEYEEDGGRVLYVTYSRGTGGWFDTEFPLVRVELE
jgi:hypothetical protein